MGQKKKQTLEIFISLLRNSKIRKRFVYDVELFRNRSVHEFYRSKSLITLEPKNL